MTKKILIGILLLISITLVFADKPAYYMTSEGYARCLQDGTIMKIQVGSYDSAGEPTSYYLLCTTCGRTANITMDEAKYFLENIPSHGGPALDASDDPKAAPASHEHEGDIIPFNKRVYCTYTHKLLEKENTFWFDPRTKRVSKNPADFEDGYRYPISREALTTFEFSIPEEK